MDGVIFSLGFFLFFTDLPDFFLVSFSFGKWVLFVTEPLFPICTMGFFFLSCHYYYPYIIGWLFFPSFSIFFDFIAFVRDRTG